MTDYDKNNFSVQIGFPGAYTKLKFTFYKGISGYEGTFGLSELFFIHPEATSPYAGLLSPSMGNLQNTGSNLVFNNGNVGIGTSAPDSKLTVAGTISSSEVKVTVDAGADFVFENDYSLPTLESVDQFIKKNNHLPGVASAQEMQKEGINLCEMNIKLLQKIEELTLYIIDMNKKVNDLQLNNSQLTGENKVLIKKVEDLEKRK
ncbi:hypothetical protein [Flavobacterium sp. C3NV]|uniref:hypothetical protein n=1 Tax=Flavobacterium sp. C3NV TaxID=3393358 RepID=UPI00398FBD0C